MARNDLNRNVHDLMAAWQELNIDPDDFVTCAACHRVFHWAAFAQDYIVGNVCGCVDENDNNEEER